MSVETMKQAVEALKKSEPSDDSPSKWLEHYAAIVALRQAIKGAEKREWINLTNEEIRKCDESIEANHYSIYGYSRMLEAKIKEKNHAS
jgi:hypothetical protein